MSAAEREGACIAYARRMPVTNARFAFCRGCSVLSRLHLAPRLLCPYNAQGDFMIFSLRGRPDFQASVRRPQQIAAAASRFACSKPRDAQQARVNASSVRPTGSDSSKFEKHRILRPGAKQVTKTTPATDREAQTTATVNRPAAGPTQRTERYPTARDRHYVVMSAARCRMTQALIERSASEVGEALRPRRPPICSSLMHRRAARPDAAGIAA